MTLRLELRIDGDSRGAQRAVDDTRKSVVQLGQESRKPAGNPLQPIEDGAGRAGNSVGSLRMIFRTLGREAAIVGGPMAGIIGQVGTLTVGAGRLGVAMTVGALSVAAIAAAAYKAVTAYSALEQQQAQNANVMATMRSGSGQTIQSLAALTRELAESGTQSVESIREAETALLRFKVGGSETFATILRLSKDVAANGFASMKDAAIALAVAIEDPAKGFDKLKEIGVNLSATQQQLVLDFYATGQRVKGVQTILNEASRQFSGSDARSADTLGASWGRLTKSTGTYFEQVGGWITQQGGLKAILDATAKAWDNATQGRFTFNPNVFGLPPTPAEQPAMPKADRLPRP
ncbi:MAG TPA: phage tail length tape measure family protein, partial [Rhodanobacteraceae bacterium]|nr:phage tail length tape measure family protein [Rhodanobacteraceae bacterium]